jgi:uncharacterized membrane protein
MALYSVFEALEAGAIGATVKESLWLFPAIEAVHLLALAFLGGALLMLDLRLLGVGLNRQTTTSVERGARPWLIVSVALMIVSGVLIGLSEALKLYDKPAFWVKMATLAVALVFTFAVKLPLARREVTGAAAKALAVVSLGLWLTVALAGRWIGFS